MDLLTDGPASVRADPRLAGEEDEPSVAAVGGEHGVFELRELAPAPHENGEKRGWPRLVLPSATIDAVSSF